MAAQDVIGSMKIEIHRMALRKRELETIKEQLMSELERSISKRDTIATKGRARLSNSKKQGALLTEQQLAKKCAELQRSVADTEGECGATDARIRSMDAQRTEMADEMEALAGACMDLRHTDVQVRQAKQRSWRLRDGSCASLHFIQMVALSWRIL